MTTSNGTAKNVVSFAKARIQKLRQDPSYFVRTFFGPIAPWQHERANWEDLILKREALNAALKEQTTT